ncbi:acyl-CoA dehydratase activase [bacterium]|nr:2-hydroxyglutaryl-CoA dehydratase [bacterium]MBU4310468.1 2-hydroxyglutaryl-CoA dehydratase [bacterium]MBU4561300.1 2-hydroxyglutaryl-CoA dehydratase [bacterium]MCG2676796.1 acyl-CoA dehydratase activase [bacterium]MCG2678143.1 acyl-CoA dehydratase activase [bacterium]
MNIYLGIDVGSISTNLAVIDEEKKVLAWEYLLTGGRPIEAVQRGLKEIEKKLPSQVEIRGGGSTGSARHLTGILIGADTVKSEIIAHAVAASHLIPEVKTIFEIGGQDSKIIIVRDGVVVDFAMNTICAAGTGSFLDHQAQRLGVPIEEFGNLALQSKTPTRVAGRCTVFAESDMIHKQQTGHATENIVAGLCQALVRNYLNNVGKGKELLPPVVFQGGVAANKGMKAAFEEELGYEVIVPEYYHVMGAIGVAILAQETIVETKKTKFKGFEVSEVDYKTRSFECTGCPNLCEVIEVLMSGEVISRWGDRCGKWEVLEK